MKKWSFLLLSFIFCICCFSQKPKITWGDEFKLRKGSTDLEVVYADKTGVYLQESHLALKGYFVVAFTARISATLVKLDKNLAEQYHNDFNKELIGKDFVQFFVLQDKLFMLAAYNNKRNKTLEVFAAEINKNSGELSGNWQPLAVFEKDEKRDQIYFKVSLNADSSKMILVSTVEGREKNSYQIQEFDKSMKAGGKPVTITNEFDPKTFQLEEVLYTTNKKTILVGRVYEYQEGKRKKAKFLDFVNYNIRIYDEKGKQQNEINTSISGKWLMSTKLVLEKDKDMVLAAFYSNQRRGKEIDGMLVQRIDAGTGNIISTSEKEINNALLTTAEEENDDDDETDEDNESRAERKERKRLDKIKDEGEGFSRYMRFRNIFYTSDQGLVILAEKYHHYYYTTTMDYGTSGRSSTRTYSVYECGDLMMCKIDVSGNISWLQVLPKLQRELVPLGYGGMSFGISSSSYGFFDAVNVPFFAGFGAIQSNNAINVIFNDNPKNENVLRLGQKVKITNRFRKSECFVLSINQTTGKYTRTLFFSNANAPTAMPRLGSVIGDDMYMIGREDRIFGKTKIAVAKVSVN